MLNDHSTPNLKQLFEKEIKLKLCQNQKLSTWNELIAPKYVL